MIDESYEACHKLLTEKLDLVDKVAEELFKKEVLTREDMIKICGPRPFPERNDAFDKYLQGEDAFKGNQNQKTKIATMMVRLPHRLLQKPHKFLLIL